MRRIGRYILNALTVLSVMLSVALAAAWVYSYRYGDSLARWRAGGRYVRVSSSSGTLYCHLSNVCPYPWDSEGWWWIRVDPARIPLGFSPSQLYWDIHGEMWKPPRILADTGRYRLAILPGGPLRRPTLWVRYWVLVVLFLWPAWLRLGKHVLSEVLRRRGDRGMHCRKCGYDLRATPDRCPECGTIPTKAKA